MVRLAVAFDAQRRIYDPLFVLVLVLVFGFSLLFNFITYPGSHSHTMPTLVANLALIGIIIGRRDGLRRCSSCVQLRMELGPRDRWHFV